IPLARVRLDLEAGLLDLLAGLLQRRVHVLALVDHPLHVVGRLDALLTKPLVSDGLESADQVEPRSDRLRQVRGLAHRLTGGLRAICAHNDRAEHQSPSSIPLQLAVRRPGSYAEQAPRA